MNPTVTLKADGFYQATRRMAEQSVVAGEEAIHSLAGVMFRKLIRLSAEAWDTGRYKRAWEVAYAMLGIEPVAITPLRESRFAARHRAALEAQATRWERERQRWQDIVSRYEKRSGHQRWKSYKEAVRILDRVGDLEDITIEQLEAIDRAPGEGEGPAVVVFGRRSRATTQSGSRSLRSRFRTSQLARAHVKVHGGRASIFQDGQRWMVYGANMEPHARIVESGDRGKGAQRILARALADAKAVGFRRSALKKYLKTTTLGVPGVKAPGNGIIAVQADEE